MMNDIVVSKIHRLEGEVKIPGDKSISHRAVIIGSIANGVTKVFNYLMCDDCLRTITAFQRMGVDIILTDNIVTINGKGLFGLNQPDSELYLGNSGTSMRLLLGVLAGQSFQARLTGDASLSKRPMKRVIEPLRRMGADITAEKNEQYAPIMVRGRKLHPINYASPIASAQVKSAILLAGLYCDGTTRVIEPSKSRDHTERMLRIFGIDVEVKGLSISIFPGRLKSPGDIFVPSDISSAMYFIVATTILKDSSLVIKDIGVNPTRTGGFEILKRMGAEVSLSNVRELNGEPVADIYIKSSELKGTTISKGEIPRCIDELPILMVAANFAEGITKIYGASELRVKETDRINSMVSNMTRMGAKIRVFGDDIEISGVRRLKGCVVDSFGDHRTAMSLIIAGLLADGETTVCDTECISTSFPGFYETLKGVLQS